MHFYRSHAELFPTDFTWGATKEQLTELNTRFWYRYNRLPLEMQKAIDDSNFHSGTYMDEFTLVLKLNKPSKFEHEDIHNTGVYWYCEISFYGASTTIDWISQDYSGERSELSEEYIFDDHNPDAIAEAYATLITDIPNFNDTVMACFDALLQMVNIQRATPYGISPR